MGVTGYFTAVLVCISLMANDTEHLFPCLSAICAYSFFAAMSRLLFPPVAAGLMSSQLRRAEAVGFQATTEPGGGRGGQGKLKLHWCSETQPFPLNTQSCGCRSLATIQSSEKVDFGRFGGAMVSLLRWRSEFCRCYLCHPRIASDRGLSEIIRAYSTPDTEAFHVCNALQPEQ